MILELNHKSRKIKVEVVKCNQIQKISGLMFHRCGKAKALLFDFKKNVRVPLHSFFVFFPFTAVWLDGKNRILEVKKVMPFCFCIKPRKNFEKIIEIPCNKRYNKITKLLDGD